MLVKTVKDRLLSASLGAPGAAQVPNAGHLRARQGPALQGLAPGCLQLPGPVTGSTGGPPPSGVAVLNGNVGAGHAAAAVCLDDWACSLGVWTCPPALEPPLGFRSCSRPRCQQTSS